VTSCNCPCGLFLRVDNQSTNQSINVLKYIEWVELYRFWKKGMILLQIYLDSDNWLTTNLIRRYLSLLNYVAIEMQSKISYLHPSPCNKEYKDMKNTNQVNYCVLLVIRVTANVLITFNIIGYEINHLMAMATHIYPHMTHNINAYIVSVKVSYSLPLDRFFF